MAPPQPRRQEVEANGGPNLSSLHRAIIMSGSGGPSIRSAAGIDTFSIDLLSEKYAVKLRITNVARVALRVPRIDLS